MDGYNTSLFHLRRELKGVARALNLRTDRVSSLQMLDLCHEYSSSRYRKCQSFTCTICPTSFTDIYHTVPTGGQLLEYYLWTFGGYSTHREFKRLTKQHGAAQTLFTEAEMDGLLERELGGFHGWVLKSCLSMGNLGKRQIFFTTFVARYFGLSRMGSSMLANYGFATSPSQYDTIKAETVLTARAQTRLVC
jgi:hypothetical protein